jgi:endonuclease/exonuclease/phosphatase family metal-dependent hydrolase
MITTVFSQNKTKEYSIRTIAFYNLENLFDTINDVHNNDEASPMMELKVNKSNVYWKKINNMAFVISQIGLEKAKTSPAIIGVAEIENYGVLEDLIKSEHLKSKNYQIIHYDSPDRRGIDVALLYQQQYFNPINHEAFHLNIYSDNNKIYTRDQLLVSGYLDNEMIHLIVNHWPSRRGGEANSRPLREKAALQNLKIIEKIKENEQHPKVLIMGDFNDDPINESFKSVLKTKTNKNNVTENDLFNPYEEMFHRGFSTLGYRDQINLFDQILFTAPLLDKGEKDFSSYKMYKAMIFNKPFLTIDKGKYKGYPFRSFSWSNFTGGYSDHYPVYIYLIKEK